MPVEAGELDAEPGRALRIMQSRAAEVVVAQIGCRISRQVQRRRQRAGLHREPLGRDSDRRHEATVAVVECGRDDTALGDVVTNSSLLSRICGGVAARRGYT